MKKISKCVKTFDEIDLFLYDLDNTKKTLIQQNKVPYLSEFFEAEGAHDRFREKVFLKLNTVLSFYKVKQRSGFENYLQTTQKLFQQKCSRNISLDLVRIIIVTIYLLRLQQQQKQQMSSGSRYQMEQISQSSTKRPYHRITLQEKYALIKEVFQNKVSIAKAASKLKIKGTAAKIVIRKQKLLRKKSQELRNKQTTFQTLPPQVKEEIRTPELTLIKAPILFILPQSPVYQYVLKLLTNFSPSESQCKIQE